MARVATDVECDLADGTWHERYGDLRAFDQYDAGLLLVITELA